MGEPNVAGVGLRSAARSLARVSADLVGDSAAMRALRQTIATIAPSDANVLIVGQSGTGKENSARALHAASNRARAGFVAVNCGAIPTELAEAELFGAEAGAFTGATRQRIGRLEAADGGTLFLDEVGELPLQLQVKLLRALETREIVRLGSTTPVAVDFRLIAATNADLAAAIQRQQFRADLYWRLAVVVLELPSLSQRTEDIPALVQHFAGSLQRRIHLTSCGAAALAGHDWLGNLRELRNLVERALAYNELVLNAESVHRLLQPARRPLADWVQGSDAVPPRATAGMAAADLSAADIDADQLQPIALKRLLAEAESALIAQALRQTNGMVAQSARLLGLKRTTLVEKMKRMGLKAANEAA